MARHRPTIGNYNGSKIVVGIQKARGCEIFFDKIHDVLTLFNPADFSALRRGRRIRIIKAGEKQMLRLRQVWKQAAAKYGR